MAISDEIKNGQSVDYKHMYRSLKRKLRSLIHENECFKAELRRIQGQYLQVHRDNEYLLDRLMQYENFESSSSDSDATESSDDEKVSSVSEVKAEPVKRKRISESVESTNSSSSSVTATSTTGKKKRTMSGTTNSTGKNNKSNNKSSSSSTSSSSSVPPLIQPNLKNCTVPSSIIKTELQSPNILPGTSNSSDLFAVDNKKATLLPPKLFSHSPDQDSSFSH